MSARVLALSGWGQPHNALDIVVPHALHVDYSECHTAEEAIDHIRNMGISYDMIVGWSLGGQLALRALAEEKIYTQKLVLIAAPFQFVQTTQSNIGMRADLFEKFYANYQRNPARTLQKSWALVAKDDVNEAKVLGHVLHKSHTVQHAPWLRWLEALAAYSCDILQFSALPPTLILHGSQDNVTSVSQAELFHARIPRSKLEIWQECGHAPHYHDAEKTRRLIEKL